MIIVASCAEDTPPAATISDHVKGVSRSSMVTATSPSVPVTVGGVAPAILTTDPSWAYKPRLPLPPPDIPPADTSNRVLEISIPCVAQLLMSIMPESVMTIESTAEIPTPD